MIDFHNHILPDIDDGSKSLTMSIEMLENAFSQGITDVVNTVHFQHPKVEKTIYPGLEDHPQYSLAKKQMLEAGSIVTFIIKGTDTFKFMNALNLFDISNNLGDTKSLITHPTTTTHRVIGEEGRKKLNIPDNMIRLSIGLEDVEDLIEDIDQALKQINN